MRVLSLFDGMACGMIAFQSVGIEVESYDAYEIDKYAIKTATHNFPNIREHGDVFTADFTKYKGVDFVIGGSPCTYWSIAQKNNRETEASGMGWELFSQYVRAVKEAQPKYFIYENNYSMSKAIRESIDKAFGFEAVYINSALVSAQNRKRLYWVGKRNVDGSYSKADVEQPTDRGIVLKDILESGEGQRQQEKARTLTSGYTICSQRDLRMDIETNGFMGKQGVIEGIGTTLEEKAFCLTATYNGAVAWNTIERNQRTMVAEPIRVGSMPRPNGELSTSQAFRVYGTDGKSVCINSGGGGAGGKTGLYAVPHKVGEIGKGGQGNRVYSIDGKSVTQTSTSGGIGSNTGLYAVPTNTKNTTPIYEVKDGFITIKGK